MEEQLKYFLNKILIEDIKKLIENGQDYIALIIMAQSIETLGSFLDNKPFRAKAQSKKRFSLALKILFPNQYRKANNDFFLFDKLRNHIAHILIPSSRIIIIEDGNNKKNMEISDGILYISIQEFYNDVKIATEKLIKMIDKKEIKYKKLDLSNQRF
jgi:hypothetical protein